MLDLADCLGCFDPIKAGSIPAIRLSRPPNHPCITASQRYSTDCQPPIDTARASILDVAARSYHRSGAAPQGQFALGALTLQLVQAGSDRRKIALSPETESEHMAVAVFHPCCMEQLATVGNARKSAASGCNAVQHGQALSAAALRI
jgi:hypothetical protein